MLYQHPVSWSYPMFWASDSYWPGRASLEQLPDWPALVTMGLLSLFVSSFPISRRSWRRPIWRRERHQDSHDKRAADGCGKILPGLNEAIIKKSEKVLQCPRGKLVVCWRVSFQKVDWSLIEGIIIIIFNLFLKQPMAGRAMLGARVRVVTDRCTIRVEGGLQMPTWQWLTFHHPQVEIFLQSLINGLASPALKLKGMRRVVSVGWEAS